MASKPKADLLSVEDFLYELGPVKKEVINFRRVEFEVATFKNNIVIKFFL